MSNDSTASVGADARAGPAAGAAHDGTADTGAAGTAAGRTANLDTRCNAVVVFRVSKTRICPDGTTLDRVALEL